MLRALLERDPIGPWQWAHSHAHARRRNRASEEGNGHLAAVDTGWLLSARRYGDDDLATPEHLVGERSGLELHAATERGARGEEAAGLVEPALAAVNEQGWLVGQERAAPALEPHRLAAPVDGSKRELLAQRGHEHDPAPVGRELERHAATHDAQRS